MRMSKSGRQFTCSRYLRLALAVWCAPAIANESVRAELTRLQKQKGLSLVALATAADPGGNAPRDRESIDTVVFGRRSLSSGEAAPAARMLALADNGSISPDGSEIALSFRYWTRGIRKATECLRSWGGTDTLFEAIRRMLGGSDFCWSPDSSKLVLRAFDDRADPCNGTLQVLDLRTGANREG